MAMTRAQFSMMAARISQKAATWSADTLILKNRLDDEIRADTADRFIAEISSLLQDVKEDTRSTPHTEAGA